jgi:hypothetical protein
MLDTQDSISIQYSEVLVRLTNALGVDPPLTAESMG